MHALNLRLPLWSGAYSPEQLPEQGPVCVCVAHDSSNHRHSNALHLL